MPGVIRAFQNYTDAELLALFAAVKQRQLTGTFTSLGGAQKTAGMQFPDIEQTLKEINFELNARGLSANKNGPQKVVQEMRPRNPNGYYDEGYYE